MQTLFEQIIDGIIDRGYGVVDNFLAPNEIEALSHTLREKFEVGTFKRAGIGQQTTYQENKTIRGDYIHWLSEDSEQPFEKIFLNRINDFVQYLNRTCYTGLQDFEFHYALYPKGTFYKRHLDQFKTDDRRKYSVICYLNDDWKTADGGELVLYLEGGEKVFLPKGGRLVCFESSKLEHEVKVAHRERLSLTGWLKSR